MICLVTTITLATLLLLRSAVVVFSGYVALATERQQTIRVTRRLLATAAREICCHGLFTVLNPLGRFVDPSTLDESSPDAERPTVILISDLGWRAVSLIVLRTYLHQRGWKRVVCLGLDQTGRSLSEHADDLAMVIREVQGPDARRPVDLVGHGVGGLVAAWYSQHHADHNPQGRLITLGTAWKGSRTAVLSSNSLGEKLVYKAPILDQINPRSPQISCIWSTDDPTIVPATSASPEFTAKCLEIEAAGHMELLASARAFRGIRTCLDAPIYEQASHA